MLETRVTQVRNEPSAIDRSTKSWGTFGWQVLSIQVTHTQNTKTYSKGLDWYTGDYTVETTTINYATITYQRDTDMPNYSRLAKLQSELEDLVNENVKPKEIGNPKVMTSKDKRTAFGLWIGAYLLVMLLVKVGRISNEVIGSALILATFIVPIRYYMGKRRQFQKEFEEAERRRKEEHDRCERRKVEIDRRCKEIVDEAESISK